MYLKVIIVLVNESCIEDMVWYGTYGMVLTALQASSPLPVSFERGGLSLALYL